MLLENNFVDRVYQNSFDIVLIWGYILDRPVDVEKFKQAFESVVSHFPILLARLDSSGKQLFIPYEDPGFVLWTAIDHDESMSKVFTPLPTDSDHILVSSTDSQARMDFYFPSGTTRVSRKGAAGKGWPLIEICVQRFTDRTVIGLAWNHMLTDAAGMAIIVSSWTKALRGEALPEVAPCNDVFKDHLPSNPAPPLGSVVPTFSRILRSVFRSIVENIRYGSSEARTIFIPNSLINEWKSNDDVSTNDLLTAWVIKTCTAAINSSSSTVSTTFAMDLRQHLPNIVPKTYLRNAFFGCMSPNQLTCSEVNKMSHFQLAKSIRSTVKQYTPEAVLNDIAYQVKYSQKGLGMFPKGDKLVICTSWSKFNLPTMDFGPKTVSFEGIGRSNRSIANLGSIWLEPGGARVTLFMCKKRWNVIWKTN